MYERHPDVSDEDLGIRAFKVKKAKAVERAVDRMRQGLGEAWKELNTEEIDELEWVLGELWAYVARAEWEDLQFGHLSISNIIRIITYGSQMRRHARSSIDILRDVENTIRSVGGAPAG